VATEHESQERVAPRAHTLSGGVLDGVVKRPVAITMCVVAIAVFGVVSLSKLPIDLLPEISYPTLTVRTTYTGAAPEDVEDRISERVQEALSTLPHLVRTTSISRAETSDVVLDFDWGTPMTFAVQDVRDKLDGVFLPEGADKPLILRYDPNLDPILRIGISAPDAKAATDADRERNLMHLRWLAEKRVKRELETLPGVAAVQVRGGLQEEIRVSVDPFKMAAQNLDPNELATRLAQENLNASGGLIREGSTDYLVRTLNEFQNLDEIKDLAIVRRNDAVIRVRDVATVTRTHARREVITRLDGGEAVEIAIYREAGANIVELADRVQERLFGTPKQRQKDEDDKKSGAATQGDDAKGDGEGMGGGAYLAHQYRKEARFEVLSDQSTFIRDSIHDVRSSAVMGIILTVLIIGLALRAFLPTLVISVSIPISVIATFAPMYLGHVSLNIMSLGGLALGVGMVVDASIVVLESVQRCRDEGDGPMEAAIRGTREVLGAITGSTLTSVAVFAPIVFVHGVAGRIFGDQALTVVSSLTASLLVAAFFIPMLVARPWFEGSFLRERTRTKPADLAELEPLDREHMTFSLLRMVGVSLLGVGAFFVRIGGAIVSAVAKVVAFVMWPFGWAHDRAWNKIADGYPRLLSGALRHAWLVVLVAAAALAFAMQRARHLGLDLLPEIHQGEFTAHVGLDIGSPIETTDEVMDAIERDVRAMDGVKLTALVVGVERDMLTRDIEGKHTARLTVRLNPGLANVRDEERVLERVRRRIASEPAVRTVDFTRPTPFALDAPVQVEVLGYDLDKIREVGAVVVARLAKVEGLSDIRTTVHTGNPEARVHFDRDKTLQFGLDLDAASKLVRDQVLGNVSTRFTRGDDRIDVRVMGDEIVLGRLDRVLDLVLNPASSNPVRLRDVADVRIVQGPAEIRRIGNTRAVVITAATTALDLGGISSRVQAAIATVPTPEDVVVQLGGQKREMDEATASLKFALFLAIFLVYAVMASQFESLLQPLIILVTIPLAMVGVVFVLDWLDVPLSIVVFIGAILLAGIVVNNAIVLIDRVNQMRGQGLGVRDALLEAAATRLRPIYMTTATTVLGLLPLTGWLNGVPGFTSTGAGAELRAPMAITVIAGLTCSTLLTLIVIPCVYHLVYRRHDRAHVTT
jgi:HAE1 family hydrophobic/amphiphilic exporter-1